MEHSLHHTHNKNNPFLRQVYRICTIYISYICDITLVAQVSSHYAATHMQSEYCETNLTNMYSQSKEKCNFVWVDVNPLFSLFFSVVNKVKEVNPYCLPVSLFDKMPTSQTYYLKFLIYI
jgi:hypothetical protein